MKKQAKGGGSGTNKLGVIDPRGLYIVENVG
jgi:hypothetical protein